MHIQSIIFVLIFELASPTLAIRQFKEEYPKVTVCESTFNEEMEVYDMPHSYSIFKGHFKGGHNCTHIEGNLIIKNIYPDGDKLDFSFLENIVEVSGMVMMVNNSIDTVILPNLKVIRGNDFYNIPWNDSRSYGIALFMKADNVNHSAHLTLPSLKVISNNSVYFSSTQVHPYLPYSVQWSELFEDEINQRLLTVHLPKDFYPCHSSCNMTTEDRSRSYCWSPLAEHCQEKTKCRESSDAGAKWCYYKQIGDQVGKIYCDPMCSGGCSGMKNDQCYVCSQYTNGDQCTSSCPPQFITKSGKKVMNPDYKRRVGMLCATTCPSNLLQQEDACIYKCTSPGFYHVKDVCEPCNRKKGCHPEECKIEESCNDKRPKSFYMTRSILEGLTGCEQVEGLLHFSDESFNMSMGGISLQLLYKYLKNVRRIIGSLSIDGSLIELHNLTFLENLEEIRDLKQKRCSRPGIIALNIFYTDLQFLGLRRLTHIYGDFSQIGNPKLCYLNTIPWSKHVLKMNFHQPTWNECDESCDPQCGTDGCWGPTNSMCYMCKGVRAGYNCVNRCEDESGYYTDNGVLPPNHDLPISYDDGTCRRCHVLCQMNCTGPSALDCVDGCLFFRESNQCVEKCSKDFYPFGKTCTPCSKNCFKDPSVDHICSGGSDHLGDGGCASCNGFILKENRTLCHHGECPPGFYIQILGKKSSICKPCTEPCSKCIGRSLDRHHCIKCSGFWSRDRCVKECTEDNSSLVQPKLPGEKCQLCHRQCNGCSSPDNASLCLTCRNKRLYIDYSLNMFTCVEICPPSHYYSYKIGKNDVCTPNSEGQEYERNERHRNNLNIVFWILGPTIATCLLASVIIFQMFKRSKRLKASNYLKAVYSNIHEPDSRILLFNKESSLAQPNMNRLLLIPTTNIVFDIHGKPLGKGAFGSVYKGIWKLSHDNFTKKEKNELDVAIKVIQVISQKAMEELLAEAKVMASVSHKHCLRLIGVCLLQKQPCLVTTFMELGSLDKYLKKHRDSLSSFTLLSWTEQIANGMAYLEMRGIIHRDLATRNVLLNSSQLVQITDFGLSRILQGTEDNNEIIVTSGQVPIRWLAPETLDMGIYSHKTDVWAYGVTLWEIFSFGERPYNDIPLKDIPGFLAQNNRLCQPDICSLETYTEMLSCWKEPQYRSTFEELMIKFASFSQHPTYYLNIPNDPCLINNEYLVGDHGGHNTKGSSKAYMWQSMYKQLPSLDGTIITCLDEYPDAESNSRVRRQSSNLSYLSGKIIFSDMHESISPLLFQSSILRESVEEDDGYLKPKKTIVSDDDHEYLEPISRDLP